jgi:hypothetical protein
LAPAFSSSFYTYLRGPLDPEVADEVRSSKSPSTAIL